MAIQLVLPENNLLLKSKYYGEELATSGTSVNFWLPWPLSFTFLGTTAIGNTYRAQGTAITLNAVKNDLVLKDDGKR